MNDYKKGIMGYDLFLHEILNEVERVGVFVLLVVVAQIAVESKV